MNPLDTSNTPAHKGCSDPNCMSISLQHKKLYHSEQAPLTPDITEELKEILNWYYLGDEDKYTPESWEQHQSQAINDLTHLIADKERQAVMNFAFQYKAERINHTLSTPANEWKRELEHLDEFASKFLAELKENL